jgi:hypothetical protein
VARLAVSRWMPMVMKICATIEAAVMSSSSSHSRSVGVTHSKAVMPPITTAQTRGSESATTRWWSVLAEARTIV